MKTAFSARVAGALALAFALAGPLQALAFALVDTQGKPQRLADYKGRWVVVNFWATWCVPCIQEIPELAAFRRAHPNVAVIGVAQDAADVAKTRKFAAKHGHDYPLVLSNDAVEKQLGAAKALPTTRIYDRAGKMVYDKAGRVDAKLLQRIMGSDSIIQGGKSRKAE